MILGLGRFQVRIPSRAFVKIAEMLNLSAFPFALPWNLPGYSFYTNFLRVSAFSKEDSVSEFANRLKQ